MNQKLEEKQKAVCPECGGNVRLASKTIYDPEGEADELVYWKCDGCKMEW